MHLKKYDEMFQIINIINLNKSYINLKLFEEVQNIL